MGKEKEFGFDAAPAKEEYAADSASRARNKTVMLTPEMTNQVRNRFQQEGVEAPPQPAVSSGVRSQSGFEAPRSTPTSLDSVPESSGFVPVASLQRGFSEPTPSQVRPSVSATPPRQVALTGDGVQWVRETPVVGFLVSYDATPNGSIFELRVGRLIVSNQESIDNVLYLTDSSVSYNHAIVRVGQSGEIQVLDNLSEHGTSIKRFGSREIERLSGDKASVEHGDVLSFGNRNFHVCIIPRES